ncbi:phage holin family protein [Pseudomonas sp. WS 5051]|uniref:phage holin family protein n=1 Tax=Pseudomonas sp. WS 5051 TaxID=2717482 RepID=UPI001474F6FA|nr:phage holin family protein [Pseudomonas sp. WS 5051]NMY56635.1 pyocin R2, holin [Pseudomonas sp. WS 5051]
MMNEPQVLLEMPVLLVILLALVGGVFGEMWRADKDGTSGWPLMRRLALRSGACVVCGVSTFMLLYSAGMSILAALAGADAAISLYQRWAAKRLGVDAAPGDSRIEP